MLSWQTILLPHWVWHTKYRHYYTDTPYTTISIPRPLTKPLRVLVPGSSIWRNRSINFFTTRRGGVGDDFSLCLNSLLYQMLNRKYLSKYWLKYSSKLSIIFFIKLKYTAQIKLNHDWIVFLTHHLYNKMNCLISKKLLNI